MGLRRDVRRLPRTLKKPTDGLCATDGTSVDTIPQQSETADATVTGEAPFLGQLLPTVVLSVSCAR